MVKKVWGKKEFSLRLIWTYICRETLRLKYVRLWPRHYQEFGSRYGQNHAPSATLSPLQTSANSELMRRLYTTQPQQPEICQKCMSQQFVFQQDVLVSLTQMCSLSPLTLKETSLTASCKCRGLHMYKPEDRRAFLKFVGMEPDISGRYKTTILAPKRWLLS